jgi:hypothetical protein
MAHGSVRGARTAGGTPSRLMLQLARKEHSLMCDTVTP